MKYHKEKIEEAPPEFEIKIKNVETDDNQDQEIQIVEIEKLEKSSEKVSIEEFE